MPDCRRKFRVILKCHGASFPMHKRLKSRRISFLILQKEMFLRSVQRACVSPIDENVTWHRSFRCQKSGFPNRFAVVCLVHSLNPFRQLIRETLDVQITTSLHPSRSFRRKPLPCVRVWRCIVERCDSRNPSCGPEIMFVIPNKHTDDTYRVSLI